eukprot:CAMPEP_0203778006 /NCGR_PEP_ID=MMETSP0099_2-20121227/7733_1 /ASSEMBLY_ACC=CAM_ASM_000209 /TAXON_ID=96639 /ORGANISM=" , Strain NY0313808BC1" /LENGTH=483 /DNA_ID=CAMNT_0050677419 /DNA_START=166 /DNA_END=1617 /DNA_ORIENTATION=-
MSISDLAEPVESSVVQFFTYFQYICAVLIGLWYELTDMIRQKKKTNEKEGYATIVKGFDSFYSRRLAKRVWKMLNNVCSSEPGATIEIIERERLPDGRVLLTDKRRRCLNLGSYNYLGFADDWQTTCRERVVNTLDEFGVSTCASAMEGGTNVVQEELERAVAEFVGKEDCIVYSMGYGTNASAIPALFGKGCLLISDTLNHVSIVNGARGSGAAVRVFKHNDTEHLERVLRSAVTEGQPLTNRPWKKIMVMVEGIYSMEGEICELAGIVDVAKKYKAYIYVDEAHSIGALGVTGRGICEYTGVDPADIDIMMGTFTKSFGAMGGYVAASKEFVTFLRTHSSGNFFTASISPVVAQQIITSLRIITGEDGTNIGRKKLQDIRDNANFFRRELLKMGCQVLGDNDSPVIPLMLYVPSKFSAFFDLCMERGLAVVVVGFPAVPLNGGRSRFCISAAHTREQLIEALQKIEEVVNIMRLRYVIDEW